MRIPDLLIFFFLSWFSIHSHAAGIGDTSMSCGYDNPVPTLGIGLVEPLHDYDFYKDEKRSFTIYDDSLLKHVYVTYHDTEEVPAKPFCCKYYSQEYFIFDFICLEKTKTFYKILVNYDQVKYLPVKKGFVFKTWPQYIMQSMGINRLESVKGNDLRKFPENSSDTLPIPPGLEMFCPLEVKGDWVKVRWDCFYNRKDNIHEGENCHTFIDACKTSETGWLKWREGNKVLISVFTMP